MGTGLTVWADKDVPPPTPQLARSLSPEELEGHRAEIASDVEIILDGYWDRRPPDHIKAGILADWSDALEDWHIEQVVYALRKWRDEKPDKKPNPGHILSILKLERGKAEVARAAHTNVSRETSRAKPDKERVSREVAADILSQAGYAPKTFGARDTATPKEQDHGK